MSVDMVREPPHYNDESGVECIDVIRFMPHDLATCVKYVWRYLGKWDPEEDLKKAHWYFDDYVDHMYDQPYYQGAIEYADYAMKDGFSLLHQRRIWLTHEGRTAEASFMQAVIDHFTNIHLYESFSTLTMDVALSRVEAWYRDRVVSVEKEIDSWQ